MVVGYARVSTPDQKIHSQVELLEKNGCEKIYTDIGSGVREDRNGLMELMSFIRPGDTIVVYKIDRIFRSLKNLVDLIDKFNQLKVHFKSITEPMFDTTSSNGRFLLQIFGAVAEFERNLISERTKVGLESARRRKKHLGRPKGIKKETLEKYQYAKHLYENKNTPIEKACKLAGIGKTSFYRVESSIIKTAP